MNAGIDSIHIFTYDLPDVNAGPDTAICLGQCVELTANGGQSYIWSTGDTTQSIEVCPEITTNYFVTAFNNNNCQNTDSVEVTVNPLPLPYAGADTTICAGSCVDLTATGGVKYNWSTGDTTQSITVCPGDTTTYYVRVYNEYDCFAEDSVRVNVLASPTAFAGNDTNICVGDCATLKLQVEIVIYGIRAKQIKLLKYAR